MSRDEDARNRDDRDDRDQDCEQFGHGQYGVALNWKSALVGCAPTVTSCVIVPNFSCHAVSVYFPRGSPVIVYVPSLPGYAEV